MTPHSWMRTPSDPLRNCLPFFWEFYALLLLSPGRPTCLPIGVINLRPCKQNSEGYGKESQWSVSQSQYARGKSPLLVPCFRPACDIFLKLPRSFLDNYPFNSCLHSLRGHHHVSSKLSKLKDQHLDGSKPLSSLDWETNQDRKLIAIAYN